MPSNHHNEHQNMSILGKDSLPKMLYQLRRFASRCRSMIALQSLGNVLAFREFFDLVSRTATVLFSSSDDLYEALQQCRV